MRNRGATAFPLLIAFTILVFLSGCSLFPRATGKVSLVLGGEGGAKTILPTIAVTSYLISFSGSVSRAPVSTMESNPTIDVEVGTWDISVEGKDSGGNTVAVGSVSGVVVAAGATTPVSIVLSAQSSGSGAIDVTVTWPSTVSPDIESVTVTVDGVVVDSGTLSTGGTPLTWVRYVEGKASGSYTLCFVLWSSGGTVRRASVQEAVQVYGNLDSSATIELTEADFTSRPAAPGGFAVAEGLGRLVLSWVDNSHVETGYTVERGTDGMTYWPIASISAPATGYEDTTAVMGQAYHYQVKATNSLGASDPAAAASGKVEAPVAGGAGVMMFSDVSFNSIRVSWQKATDNVSAPSALTYKVVRSASDNVQTVEQAEANGTAVQDWTADIAVVDATGLTAGTAYYFNVLVRDTAGNTSTYVSASKACLFSVVDHTNYDPGSVSDEDVVKAAALDVYFEHASVGDNIMTGVTALSVAQPRYTSGRVSWTATPNSSEVLWYDSNNGLGDNMRGNPGADAKITGFTASIEGSSGLLAGKVDVAMYKFCWIDTPADGTTLFNTARAALESLQAEYPGVEFVWWTMPIERDVAQGERQEYNDAVRAYCLANDQWLLDLAALESHDDSGTLHVDGSGWELQVSEYSSDGGHLNAGGALKMAKAYWRLLVEIGKTR